MKHFVEFITEAAGRTKFHVYVSDDGITINSDDAYLPTGVKKVNKQGLAWDMDLLPDDLDNKEWNRIQTAIKKLSADANKNITNMSKKYISDIEAEYKKLVDDIKHIGNFKK